MISQSTIEEVKTRANLLEVVGEVTPVKRMGSRFVALCPFHNEKSPSFYINENSYRCFGCGAFGNVISFIMQIRGLSFPDAVEDVAARYGIEIKREGGKQVKSNEGALKNDIFKINRIAYDYFRSSLNSADPRVVEYLKNRGITKDAVTGFGLGFAPMNRTGLTSVLKGLKFSEDLLLQSGLVRRNSRGELFDLFWGRLQFPIFLDSKRIAGFGGRVIPPLFDEDSLKKSPKYVNSPETAAYTKSKILYGLPYAGPEIRKTGEVYLVEGYMDVLGLSQVGVTNVVACCGTAVGDAHLQIIARFAKRLILLFDGDSAGRAAAAKCFKIFLNSPIDVWAVFLPEGEDPDSISRAYGKGTSEFLSELPRVPLIDAHLDHLIEQYSGGGGNSLGAASKGSIAKEVMKDLAAVEVDIVREELKGRVAYKLGVTPPQLESLLADYRAKNADDSRSQTLVATKIAGHEEDAEDELTNFDAQQLPLNDRHLLRTVMALREELPSKVLNDSELCHALHPVTLSFIQGLASIVDQGAEAETKQAEIKALLKTFGESWVLLWKDSYGMLKDKDVSMEKAFPEICDTIRRQRKEAHLVEMGQKLSQAKSDEEKSEISTEILEWRKRMGQERLVNS